MKKFYHVTLNLSEDVNKVFTPRVPSEKIRMKGEESKTPRICVCETLEGCLTAVPFGGSNLEELFNTNGYSCPIKVFVFYEEDIQKGNLITAKELYETDKVRDACHTGEHWIINQDISPRETFVIVISNFNEIDCDNISFADSKLLDENEELCVEDYADGHITTIEDIKYEVIDDYCDSGVIEIVFSNSIEVTDLEKIAGYFSDLGYDGHETNVVNFVDDDRKVIEVIYYSELNISLTHVKKDLSKLGFKIHSIY